MPTIPSTDGVTVSYLRLGGDGPRLLFAHATGFSATVWRPMAELLASSFDCWALDFRGHGLTNGPDDGRFAWEGTAADVLAVTDAVAPDEPWFGVGHSMGGAALVLAEQARPGTFTALWAYEPVIFPGGSAARDASDDPHAPDDDEGNFLAAGAARRRPVFASRRAAFDNYSSKPPMDVFEPAALAGYLERGLVDDPDPAAGEGAVRLACEPADEAQVYRMGGRHHAWDGLDAIACPVTVVVGDTAIPGPAAFAGPVADRLPLGSLESHPDLGHFGPMQAPGRMAESVTAAFGSGSLSGVRPSIAP